MQDREQRAEVSLSDEELGRALNAFLHDREDGSAYVVVNKYALLAVPNPVSSERLYRDLLRVKLLAILRSIYAQRAEMQAKMQDMIAAMTPPAEVPLPAYVLQARRNAVARDALLREFGAMTTAQIGENAGSRSLNRTALGHRWKSDGRIFAVPHHGTNYFPGFQFTDEGQPLEIIARIIQILGGKRAPWGLALWFTANSGWLGGRRPVDLLLEDPASVVTAAEREAEERVF